MTPKEFQVEITKLARTIGPNTQISAHISDGVEREHVLYCGVYPRGMSEQKGYFSIYAVSFEDTLEKVAAKWADYSAEFHTQVVRKMSLAIIRLTAEIGHCTDASLRQEFTSEEVARYGADACADANTIAGKGPFEIVTLGGANGAPDIIPETATVN